MSQVFEGALFCCGNLQLLYDCNIVLPLKMTPAFINA